MPRLWVWTWVPATMSVVARPMDWPYLCTTEPAARLRRASLWPRGTSPESSSAPSAVSTRIPAGSSRVVTATSSPGRSRSAHSASGSTPESLPRLRASCSWWMVIGSPVVDRAVEEPVHRQVCGGVLEGARCRLVELDPQARALPRVQQSVREGVTRPEHLERPVVVDHQLLDAEVVDRDVEVQRRRHPHRRDVRGPVDAGLDLVDRREVQDLAQPGDPAGVGG